MFIKIKIKVRFLVLYSNIYLEKYNQKETVCPDRDIELIEILRPFFILKIKSKGQTITWRH